ncbi:ribonuclease H-like domain-containing protein, partial [Tanacetum coccineum]
FGEVAVLISHYFYIEKEIESDVLSPETTYACYLVYKLPQDQSKFEGLLRITNNYIWDLDPDYPYIYLVTPPETPIIGQKLDQNTHNTLNRPKLNPVPRQRKDGWMEVKPKPYKPLSILLSTTNPKTVDYTHTHHDRIRHPSKPYTSLGETLLGYAPSSPNTEVHSAPPTDSSTSASAPLTPEDLKVENIVLSWILFTLSDSLQARIVVARPRSAKEAWGMISDLVKDNKRSRTNALKAELRPIKLGDQSMESYFQKIDSIVTILTSLDARVNDEDLVHYALEGLPDTYNQVCGYMHWKDTFPDLKTVRSLLITEEMLLKSKALALPVDSSSPMVLMANSGNRRTSSSTTPQVKSWKPCFNFAKGSCRFGESCHYVHDANARVSTNNNGSNRGRGGSDNTTNALLQKLLQQMTNLTCTTTVANRVANHGSNTMSPVAYNTSLSPSVGPIGNPNAGQQLHQALPCPLIQLAHPLQPRLVHMLLAQMLLLPRPKSRRPNRWNNHLKVMVFNWVWDKPLLFHMLLLQRLFGILIPVRGIWTQGDLYPVTSPSPIPQAYLISQHTWHQRLGHPGSELLRRLISSSFISCNKEKPPVLCHACQLGKQVRLPFVRSETMIGSCFDVIHSAVWTSPITSLSGFKYYVLFLDHYSHFVWVYSLVHKSDVLSSV